MVCNEGVKGNGYFFNSVILVCYEIAFETGLLIRQTKSILNYHILMKHLTLCKHSHYAIDQTEITSTSHSSYALRIWFESKAEYYIFVALKETMELK